MFGIFAHVDQPQVAQPVPGQLLARGPLLLVPEPTRAVGRESRPGPRRRTLTEPEHSAHVDRLPGGQIVVAVLMPALRGADGLAAVAGRRFALIAWPAFATLIITGVLNARNAGITWADLAASPAGKTLLGSVSVLAAVVAALYGVVIAQQ